MPTASPLVRSLRSALAAVPDHRRAAGRRYALSRRAEMHQVFAAKIRHEGAGTAGESLPELARLSSAAAPPVRRDQ